MPYPPHVKILHVILCDLRSHKDSLMWNQPLNCPCDLLQSAIACNSQTVESALQRINGVFSPQKVCFLKQQLTVFFVY